MKLNRKIRRKIIKLNKIKTISVLEEIKLLNKKEDK